MAAVRFAAVYAAHKPFAAASGVGTAGLIVVLVVENGVGGSVPKVDRVVEANVTGDG
jgi:hypothetical protein